MQDIFWKGKLFFIEPYPTLKLQMRVERLEGTIIKWTAEEFLRFVEKINFNPTELEKRKMRLIYSGVYPLKDVLNSVPKEDPYESKLYEGYNSNWHDLERRMVNLSQVAYMKFEWKNKSNWFF